MIKEAIISVETKSYNNYLLLWVKAIIPDATIKFIGTENKLVDNYFLKSSYKVIFDNSISYSELEEICKKHVFKIEKIFSFEYVG